MKTQQPYYNSTGNLVIPSAWNGQRLERWFDKQRVKPKKQLKTIPQQVMTARLNSGGIDDAWCYSFIESNLEKGDIIKTLPSTDTLKAAQVLMRTPAEHLIMLLQKEIMKKR